MHVQSLDYELPPNLIAVTPATDRAAARLMLRNSRGRIGHHAFYQLPALLREGDLLVVNESRVRPSRTYGTVRGKRIEVLWYRLEDAGWRTVAQTSKLRAGDRIAFDASEARVVTIEGDTAWLDAPWAGEEWFHLHAQLALPPYILNRRPDSSVSDADAMDYQTVFAGEGASIAAPTAGLHFDHTVLSSLQRSGIAIASLRLDVGPGTFRPIRTETVENHRVDAEHVSLGPACVEQIRQAQRRGGRVVAVGTTVVRALEGCAARTVGGLEPYDGDIGLTILPGHRFRAIDGLLTNFHLPGASLLAMVASFAGLGETLAMYRLAVREGYRFYSYGDAMLLLRR